MNMQSINKRVFEMTHLLIGYSLISLLRVNLHQHSIYLFLRIQTLSLSIQLFQTSNTASTMEFFPILSMSEDIQ